MYYLRWISVIFVLTFLGYMFPLFHIHSLDEIERNRALEQFNPEMFTKEFWNNQLLLSSEQAVPIQTLIPLINNNPEKAKEDYSNAMGIGSLYYYFVKGSGYVKNIEENAVVIVLQKSSPNPELRIQTGKIFGNAIRDGTNLLNVSDFPNSQQFNQISMHLNRIVENEVLSSFKNKVTVGDCVDFVGCCEVVNEETDLYPLNLIPISLTIKKCP